MERPKGSKALWCITLLTLAQLLMPGLAQAGRWRRHSVH